MRVLGRVPSIGSVGLGVVSNHVDLRPPAGIGVTRHGVLSGAAAAGLVALGAGVLVMLLMNAWLIVG